MEATTIGLLSLMISQSPDASKWNEAMLEVYNAHLANGTWTVVKLPPGQMVVDSK